MITHVAIRSQHGNVVALPEPFRHSDVILRMNSQGIRTIGMTQGFLNKQGWFLDRNEAYQVAKDCGQYNPKPGSAVEGVLYSEDLW